MSHIVEQANERETEAAHETCIEKPYIGFRGDNPVELEEQRPHIDLMNAHEVSSVEDDEEAVEHAFSDNIADHGDLSPCTFIEPVGTAHI